MSARLDLAVLCEDCRMVTEPTKHGCCAVCGSRAVAQLKTMLEYRKPRKRAKP